MRSPQLLHQGLYWSHPRLRPEQTDTEGAESLAAEKAQGREMNGKSRWFEIKGHLLLGRKVMNNLDSIFKSRDITLPTKVRLVKAMVFPVVMYGCESWTVKKAECGRIDAFELWCWRILESPLDCKEIQPVHSEGDQPWD